MNNSLILAKGRSARLSRRRALGLSALARKTCRSRARARAVDRREIDIQKWRKCWVFALLFPVPLLRHQESFPIPVESTHWGAAREFDFRDEFAADSPLHRRVRKLSVPLRDDALVALFMAGRGAFQGDPSLRVPIGTGDPSGALVRALVNVTTTAGRSKIPSHAIMARPVRGTY